MTKRPNDWRAPVALLVVASAYALFGPVNRLLSVYLATYQQVYLRVLVALLLTLPLIDERRLREVLRTFGPREWMLLFIRAFAGYVVGVGLFVLAVNHTTVANVAFICALPLTSVWGVMLYGERIRVSTCVGLALALCGLTAVSLGELSDPFSWGRGEFYALISAAGFSFALISRRMHRGQVGNRELTILYLAAGFLVTFGLSLAAREPLRIPHAWDLYLTLALGALLVATVTLLQNFAFEHVSGSLSGAILASEAFFALLFAWLIFDEFPSFVQIGGGILIVVGALIILRPSANPTPTVAGTAGAQSAKVPE